MIRNFEGTPRWLHVAALALAAVVAIAPFIPGGPPYGDSSQHNLPWMQEFIRQFWSGELYPRRLEALWHGGGGYDFFVYAPFPFWIAALAAPLCQGCNAGGHYLLASGIILFLSGFGFYIFARRFVVPQAALGGAVLYMLLPYHFFIDWIFRNAFGEFTTYIFMPLIAHYLVEFIRARGGGTALAISIAGIITTHLPSALLIGICFAIVAICLIIIEHAGWTARWKIFRDLSFWIAAGLGLSAFYWLPALLIASDLSKDLLYTQKFVATEWLFLDGKPEPAIYISWLIKTMVALTVLAWIAALQSAWRNSICLWGVIPVLMSLAAITPVSYPVWAYTPLNQIQFPWRTLVLYDFGIACIMTTVFIVLMNHEKYTGKVFRSVFSVFMIITAIGFTALYSSAAQPPDGNRSFPLYGAPEYLPSQTIDAVLGSRRGENITYAMDVYEALAKIKDLPIASMSGGGAVSAASRSSRYTLLKIQTRAPAEVTIKIFHWKHWQARNVQTNEIIPLYAEPGAGLIRFIAPAGESEIALSLPLHGSEKAGWASFILCLLLIVFVNLRNRIRGNRNKKAFGGLQEAI